VIENNEALVHEMVLGFQAVSMRTTMPSRRIAAQPAKTRPNGLRFSDAVGRDGDLRGAFERLRLGLVVGLRHVFRGNDDGNAQNCSDE
jgi:hypothetical protein